VEELMVEERWSLWQLYCCLDYLSHPFPVDIGVAVLTNYFYSPNVQAVMERRVCSYCGQSFFLAGQETALTPYLQHDVERFQSSRYHVMKDEEILLTEG